MCFFVARKLKKDVRQGEFEEDIQRNDTPKGVVKTLLFRPQESRNHYYGQRSREHPPTPPDQGVSNCPIDAEHAKDRLHKSSEPIGGSLGRPLRDRVCRHCQQGWHAWILRVRNFTRQRLHLMDGQRLSEPQWTRSPLAEPACSPRVRRGPGTATGPP